MIKPSFLPLWIIQSSYWTNVLAFPSPFLQCISWPASIEGEFDDQPLAWKCCFKMAQNCSMGFGVFRWFLLPWDARNTICLGLIGYFSQNIGLIPGRSWFCIFFTIFVFFERTWGKYGHPPCTLKPTRPSMARREFCASHHLMHFFLSYFYVLRKVNGRCRYFSPS